MARGIRTAVSGSAMVFVVVSYPVYEKLARRWGRTLAAAAIFLAVFGVRPGPSQSLTTEIKVFLAGFVIWLASVVHANLLGLKVLTGQHNVEFVGFLVFVASLGYIVARRIMANDWR